MRREDQDIITVALYIVQKQICFIHNHRHNNDSKYRPPYKVEIHKATRIYRNTLDNYLEPMEEQNLLMQYPKAMEGSQYNHARQHNEVHYGIKPRGDNKWEKYPDAKKLEALCFLESELKLPFPFQYLHLDQLEPSLPSLIRLKNTIISLFQSYFLLDGIYRERKPLLFLWGYVTQLTFLTSLS